jgi:hypothetical protein
MATLPTRGWIYILVPMLGLGLGEVRAERKVDWTPYLEQPGERVKLKTTPTPKAEPKAKAAKAPAKAKPKAQAQSKAKPKRKARK